MMQGKIVSPATFAWMTEPAKLNDGTPVQADGYTVGFGWRGGKDEDGATIAHHAGIAVGARSALVLWPDQQFGVSLLSNALWISSIDQSARMLAAPFRAVPPGLIARRCPIGTGRFTGSFGKDAVRGTMQFAQKDGLCIGEISADNALGIFFNQFPQRDSARLAVIGLDTDGGLSRAALITPIGIYDLRARENGQHSARFGSTRTLTIQFSRG